MNPNGFGHGGAYATNMNVGRKTGLITVYVAQHAGFPKNGNTAIEVLNKFAQERWGKGSK